MLLGISFAETAVEDSIFIVKCKMGTQGTVLCVLLKGFCYSLFVIHFSIFYKEGVKTRYKRKHGVFLLIVYEIVTMF